MKDKQNKPRCLPHSLSGRTHSSSVQERRVLQFSEKRQSKAAVEGTKEEEHLKKKRWREKMDDGNAENGDRYVSCVKQVCACVCVCVCVCV